MKTKPCPSCARPCYKGRRALLHGKMRMVCNECSAKALRVVITDSESEARCMHPKCEERARICVRHFELTVHDKTQKLLPNFREVLKAMVRALSNVQPPDDADDLVTEYIRGKIEGLETALELMAQA